MQSRDSHPAGYFENVEKDRKFSRWPQIAQTF